MMSRLSLELAVIVLLLVSSSVPAFIIPQFASRSCEVKSNQDNAVGHVLRHRPALRVSIFGDENRGIFDGNDADTESNANLKSTQKRAIVSANAVDEDVVASGVGGAVLGMMLGGIMLLQIPSLSTVDAPLVVPLSTALSLGAAGSLCASMDGVTGQLTRSILGENTKVLGGAVVSKVQDASDDFLDSAEQSFEDAMKSIKELPLKIRDAVVNRASRLANSIKSGLSDLPTTILEAAKAMIMAIPQRLSEYTSRKAKDMKEELERLPKDAAEAAKASAAHFAEELKSSPFRFVEHVKKAADDVLEDEPLKPVPPKMPPPGIDRPIKATPTKKSKISFFQSRKP